MPAPGVRVTLSRLGLGDGPIRMTQALTDGDGRIGDLLERPLVAGDYRLEFDIGRDDDAFFRRVAVGLGGGGSRGGFPLPPLPAPPGAAAVPRGPRGAGGAAR